MKTQLRADKHHHNDADNIKMNDQSVYIQCEEAISALLHALHA